MHDKPPYTELFQWQCRGHKGCVTTYCMLVPGRMQPEEYFFFSPCSSDSPSLPLN